MNVTAKTALVLAVLSLARGQVTKRKIAFLGLLLATPAMAVTDTNLTITGVGSQVGVGGYIFVSPGTSGGCGIIYFDTSTDAGRGILSIALTARLSGRPIARVDYTVGSGGACTASLIQL